MTDSKLETRANTYVSEQAVNMHLLKPAIADAFIAGALSERERARVLVEAVKDALDCFENDDWRCDRCGKDQELMNCNAAYYLRDALKEWSEGE